jgi:hypothetical protein
MFYQHNVQIISADAFEVSGSLKRIMEHMKSFATLKFFPTVCFNIQLFCWSNFREEKMGREMDEFAFVMG